jgi:hypothetical protein
MVEFSESSVGITMGYGLDSSDWIPGMVIFFIFTVSTTAPIQPPSQWVPGDPSFGLHADHSPPSSTAVKSDGGVSKLPHMSSWRSR